MKPVPQPKQELVVKYCFESVRHIVVRTATADASEWFVNEAAKFGSVSRTFNDWDLLVFAEYDTKEVAEYLDSYNDEAG